MMLLIGPCMFLAPLVVVLIPVAIVLWPPSLLLTGLAWLLVWPFAAMTKDDASSLRRAHKTLGAWFRTLLTPWTYFDPPKTLPTDGAGATPGATPGASAGGDATLPSNGPSTQ